MTIGDWSSTSKNSANVAASFQWHLCTCPQGSVRTWSRWVFERTGVAVSMCPYGVRWLSLNLKYVYEIMCNTCHCHCLGSGGRPLGNLNRFLTCLHRTNRCRSSNHPTLPTNIYRSLSAYHIRWLFVGCAKGVVICRPYMRWNEMYVGDSLLGCLDIEVT